MIHVIQNKNVDYLVGEPLGPIQPLTPFNDLVCDFLHDLSTCLKMSPEIKSYPDIASLSFWCRRGNIKRLKNTYDDLKSRIGYGVIFHIAPSNVPVNFAFSFFFGLLSGNANIVKVSSKSFQQTRIICDSINQTLSNEKYSTIKKMIAFIQYDNDDEVTAHFSSLCHARIIWGGDKTIRHIRQFQIYPRGVDISFADRYSFSIIDSNSILEINPTQLTRLAEGFYNDTFLMDQGACSSPHLIIWKGGETEVAKEKFWDAVSRVASSRYELEAVMSIDKYTLLCDNAIDLINLQSFKRHGNFIYRIQLSELSKNIDTHRGKFGYFFEYDTFDISSIFPIINNKYQTLTYFGFDPEILRHHLIEAKVSGVDRVVPIGRALDIGIVWDGIDLTRSLSRIISLT